MSAILVHHRVKDYPTWKRAFDESEYPRRENGIKGGCISSSISDPNELFVHLEVEDPERARKFIESPSMRTAMREAGVIGTPEVYYLTTVTKVPEPTPMPVGSTFADIEDI